MDVLGKQILEAWDIHAETLDYLFEQIPAEHFDSKPVGMSGRSVSNIFAHLNNIRYSWIELATPDLIEGLTKIPMKTKAAREAVTKAMLAELLETSAKAMRGMLEVGLEKGKLKNFKPHTGASYSYFIAHEWYHVGEICMTLTLAGNKLDDRVLYSIWEWGRGSFWKGERSS